MADLTSGVRDLRRIQLGVEQYGYATAVTPTAQLVGMLAATEERGRVFVEEASGIMSSHRRVYDTSVMANLAFEAGTEGATFEQLPYFYAMGLKGDVVPVALGGGAYRWRYTPDLVNGDTPEIFTLRYGDNRYVWESEGVAASSLSLGAESQGVWSLSATLFGDEMAGGASFEDLNYPDPLETILGYLTTVYVDNTWAGLGDTVFDATLIGWTMDIPGFHPKFFQDGVESFSAYGLASRALSMTFNLEFNANAVAEWLLWKAGTRRFVRIEALGSLISGAQYHTSRFDMCAIMETPDALAERDGNDTMSFTLRSVHDPTSQMEWQAEVINTVAAYP